MLFYYACTVAVSYCISKLFQDAVENKVVPIISYDSKMNTTSISFVSLANQDQKEEAEISDNTLKNEETIAKA